MAINNGNPILALMSKLLQGPANGATGISASLGAAPLSTGAGAGGGGASIINLIRSLIGGNADASGLGTNVPGSVGPNPVVGGAGGTGGYGDPSQIIAPYLSLLGSQGGSAVYNFLQSVLAQLQSGLLSPYTTPPAAPAPAAIPQAGVTPSGTGGAGDPGTPGFGGGVTSPREGFQGPGSPTNPGGYGA
jgi:hypothetical protein